MNKMTRYYVYAFLNGLQFTYTTWLAYVIGHGGNPGWAEAAFHMAIFLGEVPTGVIADLLGRRRSMLIGLTIGALQPLLYFTVHDTLTACIVMAISGLGGTFLSGADQALLYETAERIGGSDLARKVLARCSAIQMAALAISPAIGGLLYQWRDWAPPVARAGVAIIAVLIVIGMKEVRDQAPEAHTSIWGQTRTAFQIVRQHRPVLIMLLFAWLYNTVSAMSSQFGQAYFPYIGLSMAMTGLIFSAATVAGSGGGWLAERISNPTAQRFVRFAPLIVALGIAAMGLGHVGLGIGGFILAGTVDGMLWPIFQARFNEAIPSAQRATILSLQAAGFSMVMSAAFPAAAYLHPVTSIYTVTGVVAIVLAGIWMYHRRSNESAAATVY
jgi:MFS family permease